LLVIFRPRTKRRLTLGFRLLVTVFIFSLVVSHLYDMYSGHNTIREGWLREDKPSGNPMRVENQKQAAEEKDPSVLDEFVVKLRDFYRKDP